MAGGGRRGVVWEHTTNYKLNMVSFRAAAVTIPLTRRKFEHMVPLRMKENTLTLALHCIHLPMAAHDSYYY